MVRSTSRARAFNSEYAGSESTRSLDVVSVRRSMPKLARSTSRKISWRISSGRLIKGRGPRFVLYVFTDLLGNATVWLEL
ncbi:hypothetical protein ASPCADRAFT_211914 [Aspergillus carbonarius ITEM 5010]|uniref:Uncharacterized protein n=1 Tax=Aspergillus carbonarius (strain ITEM 5010) TaxID=602072 RepID=A0A1R3R7Y6_ASPC5|nr:hypothetical protein ASPCADRAFT_211914 [Aspergillus carbonarius ITEM 5010]